MRWASIRDKLQMKREQAQKAKDAAQAEWHREFAWLPFVVDGERPRTIVWLEPVEVRREGYDFLGSRYASVQTRLPEGGEGLLKGRVRADT
jgi:hypothetical protein